MSQQAWYSSISTDIYLQKMATLCKSKQEYEKQDHKIYDTIAYSYQHCHQEI